jgi:hypothetical protein
MKYYLLTLALLLADTSLANTLNTSTKAEIEHLFTHLEKSGCEFNRNGSWYTASEATAHLKKKYDYLVKKDMITNAESFIDKAASESSVSGKSYQVKCDGKPIVNSKEWFSEELLILRKQGQ